jgi:phage gpG-like protein
VLRITVTDDGFTESLKNMADRAFNVPEDVMKNIGQVMIRSIAQNFLDEGRPSQWQPSRAAMNEGRRTLFKTGRLATSSQVTSVDSKHVEVTTGHGLNYAKYVHFGTRNQLISDKQRGFFWFKFKETQDTFWKAMALSKTLKGLPARRFSLFQDEDVRTISEMLSHYIFFNQKEFGVNIT